MSNQRKSFSCFLKNPLCLIVADILGPLPPASCFNSCLHLLSSGSKGDLETFSSEKLCPLILIVYQETLNLCKCLVRVVFPV